jgi:hypothetical protein
MWFECRAAGRLGFTVIAFLFLFSGSAFAQPSPALLQRVRSSLHPGITSTQDGVPANPCDPFHVDIVGRDPINGFSRHVRTAVYVPAALDVTVVPTVLVVPPTGGENLIDRGYAKQLCAHGMRAAILESFGDDTTREMDLGTYDRAALRTLAAAEHLIEYLHPRGKMGILGTSLGAIQAAFILGYDERISTSVLVVGGENLPEIISASDDKSVSKVRAQQMDAGHFRSVADFEQGLEGAIQIEPSTFEDFSGPKNVAFYVATEDSTVPTKNQYDLVRAFHGSDVTLVPANHFTTILRTYTEHAAAVVKFFGDKL